MALLEQIPAAVPDNTFVLIEAFKADTEKKKVNLCPGIYRDDNAKTWVLPSVKKVINPLGHRTVQIFKPEIAWKDFLRADSSTHLQLPNDPGYLSLYLPL